MDHWHLANGYRLAGVHCGIKDDPDRRDLALIISDRPARAAGVFTQNRVCAAPVQVCRERVPASDVRGIVVCSGNANACTGSRGLADARRMTEVAAKCIGGESEKVLVCSTGVIGRHLPMEKIESGIQTAFNQLQAGEAAVDLAAQAILTTDTRIKVCTKEVGTGETYRITGFAKGAAMIGPNMATMLAFLLSDAPVAAIDLTRILRQAVDATFNCISVEGHTSTNDTVLMLANGDGIDLQGEPLQAFESGVREVCRELAQAIAADAEGASHLVTIEVAGLRTDEEARQVARTVANSALVKTAIFGADPNWGRVVSAAGYAGVAFEEKDLSLRLGDMALYVDGSPVAFDETAASHYLRDNREVLLHLQFRLGSRRCTFYTSDLGYEYVRLNAEYTT